MHVLCDPKDFMRKWRRSMRKKQLDLSVLWWVWWRVERHCMSSFLSLTQYTEVQFSIYFPEEMIQAKNSKCEMQLGPEGLGLIHRMVVCLTTSVWRYRHGSPALLAPPPLPHLPVLTSFSERPVMFPSDFSVWVSLFTSDVHSATPEPQSQNWGNKFTFCCSIH